MAESQFDCTDRITYRLGGVAGVLALLFVLWLAAESGSAVLRLVRLGLDPTFSRADRSEAQRHHPSRSSTATDSAIIDISPEVAARRRKSRVHTIRAVAAILIALLVLPGQASVMLFLFFGFFASITIGWHDVIAGGGGRFNALKVAGGPPLFFGGPQAFPLFWLITMAMSLIGFGLLTWFGAGANLICPDANYSPVESAGFGVVAIGCGAVLLRVARRAGARRASDLLAADDRHPVLYLRSFADDALQVKTYRMTRSTWVERFTAPKQERFEEVVAWQLFRYGPVVAISPPGASHQPIGAARQELDKEEWTKDIDEWLVAARLICMTLGSTAGLRWEINRIRELRLQDKLVLIFPPRPEWELQARWDVFQRNWEPVGPVSNLQGHPHRPLVAIVSGRNGRTLITGERSDEENYRIGLFAAIEQLSIDPLPWHVLPGQRRGQAFPERASSHIEGARSPVYFIAIAPGQVVGPFGRVDLRRMAYVSQIHPSTPVATYGGQWFPVSRIEGIYSRRSRNTALLLAIFGGILGLDRFYLGYIGSGFAKMLTLAGFGAWWLIDIVALAQRNTPDSQGLPLR
jgi:hypothetical protein